MRLIMKHWILSFSLLLAIALGVVLAQAPPPPPDIPPPPPIGDPTPPPPPPITFDPPPAATKTKPPETKPKPADTKPATAPGKEKAAGIIVVQVPENATIWIGDQKMTQTGTKRSFQSPPLEPGKNYFYTLKIARPNSTAGQPDTVSEHEVGVAPGQTTEVNFLKPGEGATVVPGQPYTPPRRIFPPLFRPSEGSGYR